MTTQRLALILGLSLVLPACGDDSSTAEGGSGSSDTGGSEGSTTVAPTTSPTATMTDSMGTNSGTGSTTSDDTTTTGTVDSSGTTNATTGPATDSGSGSSSGGMEEPAYPPCMNMDPPCPDPYDHCYGFVGPMFSVCSQMCVDDAECPQPASGDAPAVCAGPGGDECVLDCGGGETCPDGMECVQVGAGGMIARCAWPV